METQPIFSASFKGLLVGEMAFFDLGQEMVTAIKRRISKLVSIAETYDA